MWLKVGLKTSETSPFPYPGMEETKATGNTEESLLYVKRQKEDCPFPSSVRLKHVAQSVCLSVNRGDYALLTSTNHLKYPNHSINPDVVLTNSICQGTFLDTSLLSTAALS